MKSYNIALLSIILLTKYTIGSPNNQQELVYSITVRDIYTGPCSTNEAKWIELWGSNTLINNEANVNKCPYFELIGSGDIVPNPDFEAPLNSYQNGYPVSPIKLTVTDHTGNEVGPSLTPIVLDSLKYETSGIGKPVYCSETDDVRCGKPLSGSLKESTSGYEAFSTWFHDDRRTNRRVGMDLKLNRQTNGLYTYDSDRFDPLKSLWTANRPDDADDAIIWDKRSQTKFDSRFSTQNYHFTTEIHSQFRYNGNETFTFNGDDDFWAFINGKLAVDIGGLHQKLSATIELSKFETELNLTAGNIYSLDLFHAERHTVDSNFGITTTLVSACNVIRSGATSFSYPATEETNGVDFFSSPGVMLHQDSITLIQDKNFAAAEYLYNPVQQNIGAGFVNTFSFAINSEDMNLKRKQSDGFAFVLHRRKNGLKDLPSSVSGNLNFAYLENSIVVAFDLCADRPACTRQQLSLHYVGADSDLEYNLATNETRQFYIDIATPLTKGQQHSVVIQYLESPKWLEVYIDNSLYLVDRNFEPETIIGGRDAYVGFTSGTSATHASEVTIQDWTFKTVSIETRETTPTGILAKPDAEKVIFIADGKSTATFSVQTRDVCQYQLSNGGFSELMKAELVPVTEEDDRKLLNSTSTAVEYEIVDNLDGTYSAVFTVTEMNEYDLYLSFGAECNEDPYLNYEENMNLFNNGKACWAFKKDKAASAILAPTMSPIELPIVPTENNGLDEDLVLGLGIAGAGMVFCCGGTALYFAGYYHKFKKYRRFIKKGKMIKLEEGMEYTGREAEYDELQKRYQSTRMQLLREQAKDETTKVETERIDEMKQSLNEITSHMRAIKQKHQEDHDQIITTKPKAQQTRRTFFSIRKSRKSQKQLSSDFIPDDMSV